MKQKRHLKLRNLPLVLRLAAILMVCGSILILDVDGVGAGAAVDPTFIPYLATARAKNIRIMGYADTAYASRPASQVQTEVQHYKAWYGVTDIFLDQTSSSAADLTYYRAIYDYIHGYTPGSMVMLNPGTYPDEQYVNVSDNLMVFENYYSTYPGSPPPAWVANYPANHFAHINHTAGSQDLLAALGLMRDRNAGYVLVTDRLMPNPYDGLPSYWSNEIADITASCNQY